MTFCSIDTQIVTKWYKSKICINVNKSMAIQSVLTFSWSIIFSSFISLYARLACVGD